MIKVAHHAVLILARNIRSILELIFRVVFVTKVLQRVKNEAEVKIIVEGLDLTFK